MKKRNVYLILFTVLLTMLTLLLPLAGCQRQVNAVEKQGKLLDYSVTGSKAGYEFPGLTWGLSSQQVLAVSKLESADVTDLAEQEKLQVKENITFNQPAVEASVLYVFSNDELIGVDLLVAAQDAEALSTICKSVSEQAKELLEKPDANSLDMLAKCDGDVKWLGEDGSSFAITLPTTQPNEDKVMVLSVRAPKN